MGAVILTRTTGSPTVEEGDAVALPLPQATEPDPMVGASINARIHPHGRSCRWRVEYGPTSSYGSLTPVRSLPGKLAAYHIESFGGALHGYKGGYSGDILENISGDFARYTAEGAAGDDDNHLDGIGMIHLPIYFYCGWFTGSAPAQHLGGGHPDLRGAQFSMRVRGNSYVPNGSELSTWIQASEHPELVSAFRVRATNWANTGNYLTEATQSGDWEDINWTLRNRIQDWTYAGRVSTGNNHYWYKELDSTLSDVNVDLFPLQSLFIDYLGTRPTGTIDFDDIVIAYRNHNLLADSNGGRLLSEPAGGSDATVLTDGYRNGAGHEWESAASPGGSQEFVYGFVNPILPYTIMVHNSTTFPSQTVEILVSEDGVTYTTLGARTLPSSSVSGPNYVFHRQVNVDLVRYGIFKPIFPRPIKRMKIRITAGYQSEAWGLGAVEVFGTGARETTDDSWYDVNMDIELAPGTYHYRVVAVADGATTFGDDQTVVIS